MPAGSAPGERRGGRKVGALGKRTLARKEIADKALEQGISPVEVMIDNMRWAYDLALKAKKPEKALEYRTIAQNWAEDCANYFHPKLAAIEHTGADGGPIQTEEVSETDLARRLAFLLTRGAQAAA